MPETRIVVVGTKFRGSEAMSALGALVKGAPVSLLREPDNQHDPGAIACYVGDTHIGYLPRAQYGAIRAAMDAGLDVAAELSAEALIDNDSIALGGAPRLTVRWEEKEE